MSSGYPWNDYGSSDNSPHAKGLLGSGWRPLVRQLDLNFLGQLMLHDTWELSYKVMDLTSSIANAMGRNEFTWWANLLNAFSEDTRYTIDQFWNYVTPEPPAPDRRFKDVLSTETPIKQTISRDNVPVDFVLRRLQEITILKILEFLGRPDIVTQYCLDRYFYYPVERFTQWERLEVIGVAYAYWAEHKVWLQIDPGDRQNKRWYTLIADDMAPLIHKATFNLAVMLSGYQSRVGKVHSQFTIRDFPAEVQAFTDAVQHAILNQTQLAVLVQGEPGTGKTAWTQAIAKEILAPLGYVIFILDHDAVENFIPPGYLERICIIINEADNLAKNRAFEIAQSNNKTEHILSLLDGTLYQSVVDEMEIQAQQRLVVLMTCNTTERLDPAVLRKGRVDLIGEFTHQFV
ncbi:AAA family ATPase [Oscillatoria sp. FACHB-1407]|uniref:AAA family ATPase n=1 Tax=Oscillatoria sp. FACHB-1407 TaxID=2692847 RepID=UPI0016827C6E|nr:AAA family ATPase [Oscillatoria sp. FACHB-1407]MBD2464656.1 AAA family ATPase [Oscillatoria sp. FACHB-1407]